jgi:hypothetical protein
MHPDKFGFMPEMHVWFNTHKSSNIIQHLNRIKDKNHMIIPTDAEKPLIKFKMPSLYKL